MNKSDLIVQVTGATGYPQKKIDAAVNLLFDMMSDELAKGGRIEIRGFGSFAVRTYKSYKGRNPRTGENVTVEPKRLPHFKVGKELRERVNLDSNNT